MTNISRGVWYLSMLAILLIAAALRMYDLDLVPFHHDEGVNGNFLVRLVREGLYFYDPSNYHGPTLYYFSALWPWAVRILFGPAAMENYGLTDVAVRMVPVIFGLGTIVLVFLLRRWLGTIATLTAALLLALSPGHVYLSRYFIHEMQFAFFTLGIVVAALYFYERRNAFYLMLGSVSAALLFATKETAMISVIVLLIAFGMTLGYMYLTREKVSRKARGRSQYQPQQGYVSRFVEELGGPIFVTIYIVLALIIFCGLWIAFYTSFFQNAKGLTDSFETFRIWRKTGNDAHVKWVGQYFVWLMTIEGPLLILGILGASATLLASLLSRRTNYFVLFSALWAFGLIAAYSLIPYKTPWLMLSFLIPLALVSGYAIQTIYELDKRQLRLVLVFLCVPVCVSTYQTLDLNFKNYDNDNSYYVYVYAHTTRGILDLVKEIDKIADKQSGSLTGVTIVSPDYWPLPWYLRNYTRVGYYGQMAPSTEPIIIANESQKTVMEENFSEVYRQVGSGKGDGSFELRPGIRLLLYERRPGITPVPPPSIR